ncbi:MAG: hypothetical protein RIS76_2976 [Verrucomicrobiota bacterium]
MENAALGRSSHEIRLAAAPNPLTAHVPVSAGLGALAFNPSHGRGSGRCSTSPDASRRPTFSATGFRRSLTLVAGAVTSAPCGIPTSAKYAATEGKPAFGRPPLPGFQKAPSGISPDSQA